MPTVAMQARLVGALLAALFLLIGGCADDAGDDPEESQNADIQSILDAALAAHAREDLVAAKEGYLDVLEIDDGNKFAYYNLALIDEAEGNYGLAESKYRRALASDPDYGPALFNLAILMTRSDPDEAITLYRHAVEVDPQDASSWYNLGLLLQTKGQNRAAERALENAIELTPELASPSPSGE